MRGMFFHSAGKDQNIRRGKPPRGCCRRRFFREKGSAVREWTESIIIAFILAMFIRTFFIQAFKIPSGSMRPTLIERDRLMVNKLRYGPKVPFTKNKRLPGLTKPRRGDVVVFIYPADPSRDFIKRLVGFGGETVEIKEGDIYIDGERVEDPRVKDIFYYNRGEYGKEGHPVTVPEGHYFVLGDNSGSSSDGRFWGFVPEENMIGRAELIYWPFNRMRFIQ
jgi:signal peptidase I